MTDYTGPVEITANAFGDFHVGVPRWRLERLLGPPDQVFQPSDNGLVESVYKDLGVFVTYDERDRISFVEVHEGRPTVLGIEVLNRSPDVVFGELEASGLRLERENPIVFLPGVGVTLFYDPDLVRSVGLGDAEYFVKMFAAKTESGSP